MIIMIKNISFTPAAVCWTPGWHFSRPSWAVFPRWGRRTTEVDTPSDRDIVWRTDSRCRRPVQLQQSSGSQTDPRDTASTKMNGSQRKYDNWPSRHVPHYSMLQKLACVACAADLRWRNSFHCYVSSKPTYLLRYLWRYPRDYLLTGAFSSLGPFTFLLSLIIFSGPRFRRSCELEFQGEY